MIRRLIRINRKTYAVPSVEAFVILKKEVIAAALAGAGLVELPILGDDTVSVMITPYTFVLFEERRDDDDGYTISPTGVELLGDSNDDFAEFDY